MREYKNSMLVTWIGVAISVAVIVLNFWDVFPGHERWWVILIVVVVGVIYVGFIVIVILVPIRPDPDFFETEESRLALEKVRYGTLNAKDSKSDHFRTIKEEDSRI